jgi:hypothetical protein
LYIGWRSRARYLELQENARQRVRVGLVYRGKNSLDDGTAQIYTGGGGPTGNTNRMVDKNEGADGKIIASDVSAGAAGESFRATGQSFTKYRIGLVIDIESQTRPKIPFVNSVIGIIPEWPVSPEDQFTQPFRRIMDMEGVFNKGVIPKFQGVDRFE